MGDDHPHNLWRYPAALKFALEGIRVSPCECALEFRLGTVPDDANDPLYSYKGRLNKRSGDAGDHKFSRST